MLNDKATRKRATPGGITLSAKPQGALRSVSTVAIPSRMSKSSFIVPLFYCYFKSGSRTICRLSCTGSMRYAHWVSAATALFFRSWRTQKMKYSLNDKRLRKL